ncbi:MAG: NCS2 family permease [Lachnospiraceae bacterium]|nr:NCS2 family permease [Lachnospiraceae bacterium]
MLEKQFHLKEHGTTVHTEIIGGITTFLSMAYILAVNPSILGAVMDPGGVFAATALASGVATLVMALYANYPIALSAGLGVNAYFAYTVCLGELGGAEGAFRIALTAVLVEGIIFIIMSFFKIREQIVNSIPENLKFGITCGIGLFITFIGFVNAGIVINDDATLVGLGSLKTAEVALALIGFLIIITLIHYNVTGAVLIGIILTWILGMIAQSIGWYQGVSVFPDFSGGFVANLSGLQNTAFKFDFAWAIKNLPQFVAIVFAFLYVDLFDTVGTVVGVADKAGLLDEDGNIPRVGRIFFSDAIGTVTGACLGTSTITSFVESSAGVGAGAKTGLASVVTGLLFLVSILLSPVFLAVPSFATAPALIYVGMLMISSAKKINYDGDLADTVGAFLALAMMPLTYSIATGIMFSVMSWVLLKVFTGKAKDISPVMWVVFVLFALRIAALVTNFM